MPKVIRVKRKDVSKRQSERLDKKIKALEYATSLSPETKKVHPIHQKQGVLL